MAIVRDGWRELGDKRRFYSTGHEVDPGASKADLAYALLAERIEDEFGELGGSAREIYWGVTRDLGLTTDDTMTLLKAAKRGGYIK